MLENIIKLLKTNYETYNDIFLLLNKEVESDNLSDSLLDTLNKVASLIKETENTKTKIDELKKIYIKKNNIDEFNLSKIVILENNDIYEDLKDITEKLKKIIFLTKKAQDNIMKKITSQGKSKIVFYGKKNIINNYKSNIKENLEFQNKGHFDKKK